MEVIIFGKKNRGGHKFFDDKKVGSHKMTTDSVFKLFKKTDFNTILACLGVRCMLLVVGSQFCCRQLLANLGSPSKENDSPLEYWEKISGVFW